MEQVFRAKSSAHLEIGELKDLLVAPSKPYHFVACNDTEHKVIFASVTTYDFLTEEWVSNGWLPLSRGCTLIDSEARGPIYGYAITRDKSIIWGGEEDGAKAPFCLNLSDSFKFNSSECQDISSLESNVKINYYEQLFVPDSSLATSKSFFWRIKSTGDIFSH